METPISEKQHIDPVEGAKDINVLGLRLDQVVEKLIASRDRGDNTYAEFNGYVLYSKTIDMDKAYIAVTGDTKAEYDRKCQLIYDKYKKEDEEFEKNKDQIIATYKSKGHRVLERDYWEIWDSVVPIRVNDMYHGMELKCSLDVIEAINNDGSVSFGVSMLKKQGHSGNSYYLTANIIHHFLPKAYKKDFGVMIWGDEYDNNETESN